MQIALGEALGMDRYLPGRRLLIRLSALLLIAEDMAAVVVEAGEETGIGVVVAPFTMIVTGTGLPQEHALKRGVIGIGMTVTGNATTATSMQILVHETRGTSAISVTEKLDQSRRELHMNHHQRRRMFHLHLWRLPHRRLDLFLIGQRRRWTSDQR